MGDPWEDEGFGGEDDWEGKESVETGLEDDLELNLDEVGDLELGDDDELGEEDLEA